MTLEERVHDVRRLLKPLPLLQGLLRVEGGAAADHQPVHHLGGGEGGHHGDPAPGGEAEHGGLGDLELGLEAEEVRCHLLDGGVGALGRVSMIPGIGNDDRPLGHVMDLLSYAGEIFFSTEQCVLYEEGL